MTLIADVVKAPTRWEEAHHKVRLWSANGETVWTNSVNGLCYTVALRTRPFNDDRHLRADDEDYYGDEAIRGWVEANLPLSLAQARSIAESRG